jgi:Uma2 family endonuclease
LPDKCKDEPFSSDFDYAKMTGMATPAISRDDVESMADLLARLGNISPRRVLLKPLPGTATEKDVLRMEGALRKRLCELVDGTLVEKATGFEESFLAAFLIECLNGFVRPRNLGIVSGESSFIRLRLGLVRIPDLVFVSWDRMPRRRRPTDPILKFAPDLAVEVLSKSNTRKEMARKRKEYFRAGTRLVWEVDPRKRQVQVFTSPEESVTLTEADTLTGNSILRGFKLPLKELFAELDRHG